MRDKGEETKAKEGSADGSFPIQSAHSEPRSVLDPTDAAGPDHRTCSREPYTDRDHN